MQIEKFVWDLTYACPLRCTHCYSESGRRAPRTPTPADLLRIADIIVQSGARRVSLSGGEPLLVRGWDEAARRLRDAGIAVTLFTSGWLLEDETLERILASVDATGVSLDGADAAMHDAIRQRQGSFERALAALEKMSAFKRARAAAGQPCFTLGVEFTVLRSNRAQLGAFVDLISTRFPGVDNIRLGMAIPEGPAADEAFAERELLAEDEMLAMLAEGPQLAARAANGVNVSVTDMRYYMPYSPYGGPGRAIAHIEPDGQLRAFGVYEAKVGSVLEEPLEVLWARALAWRNDPFVVERIGDIKNAHDWARAARVLDRKYGSPDDLLRIERRNAS
jgi:MoaA/NifB/PqqE/SkfB family radical SAM enzyme